MSVGPSPRPSLPTFPALVVDLEVSEVVADSLHRESCKSVNNLYNIPYVFGSVAELAAGHAGAETVVADTDRVVFESVREIVVALCHRSHKDTDTFFRS